MKIMNNKKIKISLTLNILTVILTIIARSITLSGFKFMKGYEAPGELTGIQAFGYFTVQSNVFMAIISFAFVIKLNILLFISSCILSISTYDSNIFTFKLSFIFLPLNKHINNHE